MLLNFKKDFIQEDGLNIMCINKHKVINVDNSSYYH